MTALSFVFSLAIVSSASAAGCNLVSGKTYYSDGVSFFSDSACHQEMTSSDLNAAASTATTYTGAVNNNCRQVSGRTYYSDGVSFFSDSACHQEIISSDSSAGTTTAATTDISSGSGNCRYDSSRMQFTDGVSYFTDNKCLQEALNGETVSNASASLAAAATPSTVTGDTQLAQLSLRVDTLEKRMISIQSILVQLLSLLSSR